ncbi:MAG: DUF448 domain-containing protein [Alphaproteobacteria bacterium]
MVSNHPIETLQHSSKALPSRKCLATGQVKSIDQLLRFVVMHHEGSICLLPDLVGGQHGRGFWLSGSRRVIAKAVEKKQLLHAVRRALHKKQNRLASAVLVATDLADITGELLYQHWHASVPPWLQLPSLSLPFSQEQMHNIQQHIPPSLHHKKLWLATRRLENYWH